MAKKYDANSISTLSDKEAMRTRGTMYFGSYSIDAVYHTILELVSNAVDECMAGYGTKCTVKIHADNSIEVSDDGRGIPVGINKEGDDALLTVFSVIHAGSKFDSNGEEAYNTSGGLNGVGIKISTYTSKFCHGTIKRDGGIYEIEFKDGDLVKPTTKIGTSTDTGTKIHYLPDVELFGDINVKPEEIINKLKELSYLTKGYIFEFIDERDEKYKKGIKIKSKDGLLDYLTEIVADDKPLCKPIYGFGDDKESGTEFEFAMQYIDSPDTHIKLFTNNIPNLSGQHYTGFSASLTSSINKYARAKKLLGEKDTNFTGNDLQEGLVLIANVKMRSPQFKSQVKDVLSDARGRTIASKVTKDVIDQWLNKNTKEAKAIITKILKTQKALAAARKAKERITGVGSSNRKIRMAIGDSFRPCKETDPSKCEIYITEGKSASSTVCGSRNPDFQAVLGLRGKILNTEKEQDLDKILNPAGAIKDLVLSLGCDIDKALDLTKLRYQKVIIMVDADSDGNKCVTCDKLYV